ncbi:MAG: DUF5336 domain-containing protein [Mycobacteriaceae bacterium]|nr:DUF5336 domain-containing protein [Mycobacteriaceae bacterium]
MTYSPGSSGYPPAPPPGAYGTSTPSSPRSDVSKLPLYLNVTVAVLGPAAYLASFGPMFTIYADLGPGSGGLMVGGGVGTALAIVASLLSSFFGAISLLPKAKSYVAVVAALAVLGALLVIAQTVNAPNDWSIGWALWLILGFCVVQGFVAVVALLLESGVITAPAPRPRYDPYASYGQFGPYGHYGAQAPGYYGQQHASVPQPGRPQPAGYRAQYPYPAPSSGFGAVGAPSGLQQHQDQVTDTPPTGFPSLAPTTASPAQQGEGVGAAPDQSASRLGQDQEPSSSTPTGPTPA